MYTREELQESLKEAYAEYPDPVTRSLAVSAAILEVLLDIREILNDIRVDSGEIALKQEGLRRS